MSQTKPIRAIAFILSLAALSVATGATPPAEVNFQGVLRDAAGNPRNGQFDVVFRFFDQPSSGSEILIDRHVAGGTGAVPVTNGLFSVHLGSGAVSDGSGPGSFLSLSEVFASVENVYLEVQIGGETLSPRSRVVSAAYSLNAGTLAGASSGYYLSRVNHQGTQAPNTIFPQGSGSGLNADSLDGRGSGNSSGDIPINNGALSSNLNADLLDGLQANELISAAGGGLTCTEVWRSAAASNGNFQSGSAVLSCPNATELLGYKAYFAFAADNGGSQGWGYSATQFFMGVPACWNPVAGATALTITWPGSLSCTNTLRCGGPCGAEEYGVVLTCCR